MIAVRDFIFPWNKEGFVVDEKKEIWNDGKFIKDVKNAMNEIVVSHKNTRLLISPSKNKGWAK